MTMFHTFIIIIPTLLKSLKIIDPKPQTWMPCGSASSSIITLYGGGLIAGGGLDMSRCARAHNAKECNLAQKKDADMVVCFYSVL